MREKIEKVSDAFFSRPIDSPTRSREMTHPQDLLTKTTIAVCWNSEIKLRPWRDSGSPYPCVSLQIKETDVIVADMCGGSPPETEHYGPTIVWLEEDHMKDIIEQYEALKDQRAKGAREEKAVAEEVA